MTERLNCQIKADYFLQSPNPKVINEDSTLKASERLDMEKERFKKRKTAIFLRTDISSDISRVRMNTKLQITVSSLYKQSAYEGVMLILEEDKHTSVKNSSSEIRKRA